MVQFSVDKYKDYFNFLEENNIILKGDWGRIDEKILSKGYDRLNICPGITIRYTWSGEKAIELDRSKEFEKDFYEKLITAFGTIGGL